MTPTEPSKPVRVNLHDVLLSLGREEEASGSYTCGCCGRVHPASSFVDVRDQPLEKFNGQFACYGCVSDFIRQEQYEYECAHRQWRESQGTLDEETLNGLRAVRDGLLLKSDWTQYPDNIERMSEAEYNSWKAYRASVRAWLVTARDTGVVGTVPTAPDQPENAPVIGD